MKTLEGYALTWETPASWAPAVAAEPLALLADHAQCELKAATSALALLKRNPHRPGLALCLVPLVREETEHLQRVLQELEARGADHGLDQPSPYAGGLLRGARATCAQGAAFLDALLVSALIEARSHERMAALAACAQLEPLEPMYRLMCEAEERHGQTFVELALAYHDEAEVQARWQTLAALEGELIAGLPFAPRMHSGPPPGSA